MRLLCITSHRERHSYTCLAVSVGKARSFQVVAKVKHLECRQAMDTCLQASANCHQDVRMLCAVLLRDLRFQPISGAMICAGGTDVMSCRFALEMQCSKDFIDLWRALCDPQNASLCEAAHRLHTSMAYS